MAILDGLSRSANVIATEDGGYEKTTFDIGRVTVRDEDAPGEEDFQRASFDLGQKVVLPEEKEVRRIRSTLALNFCS